MKRAVVAAVVLTFVFMAAVGLVCLVVAVWMTVAHRHRQQTAATVTHKLLSGAALWENTHRCTWIQMVMNARARVFADTHTHTRGELTVSGQNGPVLRSEAAACDAAIRVEGDPHCAAVCVHCWWRHVTAEPAGGRATTFNNLNLSFE